MNSLWQAPIVVVALITWLNATPTSFADAAQREALRRQLMPKPTRQLSNYNLPASAIVTESSLAAAAAAAADASAAGDADAKAAPAAATAAPAADSHDEKWWRDRVAQIRKQMDDHKSLAGALQSQINGLTADFTARDDPAQRAKIADDRRRALDQLDGMNKQVAADQQAIVAVQDDARRAGVPATWVR
jgi:hypothetical protein